MKTILFALGLSGCVIAGSTHAHEVRPAYLEIHERAPNRFDVLWKQPSRGALVLRLRPRLSNGLLDARPDRQDVSDSFLIRRWNGRPLTRERFNGAMLRIEGLEGTITDALVRIDFASGQQIQTVLTPDNPQLRIRLTGTGHTSVPEFLSLGVEHILTGFDHLSFVLGLVLLVRGRWRLFQTITAFTIAHSITLGCAALSYVRVQAPVIEALVALSIVFVAVELVRSSKGHGSLTTRWPWLIALSFGLLHGFAFAGSLAEVGLPLDNIPVALLLFNFGVEIGQVLFVAAVLVFIAVLRRWQGAQMACYGRWAIAYAIGVLGFQWMLERVDLLIQ